LCLAAPISFSKGYKHIKKGGFIGLKRLQLLQN